MLRRGRRDAVPFFFLHEQQTKVLCCPENNKKIGSQGR